MWNGRWELLNIHINHILMTYKMFIFFVIVTGVSSCGHPGPLPAPPPVSVNVDVVKQENAIFYNTYPATVTAVNQVEVRSQVAGYITGIFFNEGQHVEKGQKLYQIDQQQYLGAYEQAVHNSMPVKRISLNCSRMPTVMQNWVARMPSRSKRFSMQWPTWKQPKNRLMRQKPMSVPWK